MAKYSIFVTLGTSHFAFPRMLQSVGQITGISQASGEYDLTVQYGSTDMIALSGVVEQADFFSRERTEELYRTSDVVMSHCGIGSIFNSLKYNRPTILFTRLEAYGEFTDDHQLQIANELQVNPLLFIHRAEQIPQDARLQAFIAGATGFEKRPRDLINYEMARYLKGVLYG